MPKEELGNSHMSPCQTPQKDPKGTRPKAHLQLQYHQRPTRLERCGGGVNFGKSAFIEIDHPESIYVDTI